MVGSSNDEILTAFRDLSAWSKENLNSSFEQSALKRPLIGLGVSFAIGVPAMNMANMLAPSLWAWLPILLSFVCLVGACLSLLAMFAAVPSMAKQMLAITSRFGGLSAYSGGFGGSLAYAGLENLLDMPRADAGSAVERFDTDIRPEIGRGLQLKRPKGAVSAFRSRDFIKAAIELMSRYSKFLEICAPLSKCQSPLQSVQ